MQRYFWKSAPPRQVRSPRKEKRRVVAEHAQTRVAFQAEKSAWGELAVSRAVYDRWLADMGRLGIRVIRVYTILRPGFYDALASYNGRHPDAPLLLIQGVWIPEQQFVASGNAYAPAVTNGFRSEIRDAVAVVHGNANLPLRHGHAGGRYRSNVSRWLLAGRLGSSGTSSPLRPPTG